MKKFKKIILPTFIVLMLVIVSIILSKLFNGQFIETNANKKDINLQSVYFVSAESFSNAIDAQNCSNEISKVGGAGFVYNKENVYYVITSFYLTEKEASSVCTNLKLDYINAQVLKIDFKKVSLSSSEFSNNFKQILISFIEFYAKSSISLDKGEISKNQILLSSLTLNANIDECLKLLESSAQTSEIKSRVLLKTLKSNLTLINVNSNFSQTLKYLGVYSISEIRNSFLEM